MRVLEISSRSRVFVGLSRQLYRICCNDVDRSRIRQHLGHWVPTGELLVTIDVVIQRWNGCSPVNEGTFVGCEVREVNADLKVGVIARHPGTRHPTGSIVPVVAVDPVEGIVQRLDLHRWKRASTVVVGERVRVLFTTAIDGEIIQGVQLGTTHLCGTPIVMPLFHVELDFTQMQETERGAPVVLPNRSDELLGMVVSVPTSPPHSGTLARCYPAQAGFGA